MDIKVNKLSRKSSFRKKEKIIPIVVLTRHRSIDRKSGGAGKRGEQGGSRMMEKKRKQEKMKKETDIQEQLRKRISGD